MKFRVNLVPVTLVCAIVMLLSPIAGTGDELPLPQGKVILIVSGNIGNTNSAGKASFDREMLEALGVSELALETPWTEGRQTFSGVLGVKVLDAVAAKGEVIVARALNDYQVEIPVSDFRGYPILFALKQNGKYMRVRDKGPIWIIYPTETHPVFDNDETREKWLWQLSSMHIR